MPTPPNPTSSPFTEQDLSELAARLQGDLVRDPAEIAPYLLDWRKRWQGKAFAVALPHNTNDVATLLGWCHERRVPVVPQGGNTGLSGGATPDPSGQAMVICLKRMNHIGEVDPLNNTVRVQAGAVLQAVQEAAIQAGRLFPLSLASEGSCTIGGNLSTNAGGVQVLRYGTARELCLGLEVVSATGEVWNGLRGLRKDNTGYALKDLFIGAEGTLGIITEAVLKVFPLPTHKTVALVAVNSVEQAMQLFNAIRSQMGADLSAFELMSELCVSLVTKHFSNCRAPFKPSPPWTVLIEVSSSDEGPSKERLLGALQQALESDTIVDVVVSESVAQAKAFWALRENISEAQAHEGKNIKHDIAVPISSIAEFVRVASQAITEQFKGSRMVVFGHLGDGNLHFNVSPAIGVDAQGSDDFLRLQDPINQVTHDWVAQFDGSISAEHGLGILRRDESARYKSKVEMALMRSIKTALDPLNLMNPGKVLPPL